MTFSLSPLRLSSILLLGALLGGCDTIEDHVRTTREVPVVTHEFEASADAVMTAAQAAFIQLGFSVTEISTAHGEIDAITDIRRDAGMRNSRQTRLQFTVEDRDGGYSLATLRAWDIREEENARGERLMSESGVVSQTFHNSMFDAIQEMLVKKTN